MCFTKNHCYDTYHQFRFQISRVIVLSRESISEGCTWGRQKWMQSWYKFPVFIRSKHGSGIFCDLRYESRVACNVLLQTASFCDYKNANKHFQNCSQICPSNSKYQAKFISPTGFGRDTPGLNLACWPLCFFRFGVNVRSCEDDGLRQTEQARALQASPQKFCWYSTILTCKTSAAL